MRQALKKLTALLLSIAMVLSLFTDILPAAYADEGGVSAPSTGAEVEKDYDDIVTTRQPGLYVDFLGDNRNYLQGRAVDTVTGIAVPGSEDQNAETNNNGVNTWRGYQRDEQDAAGNSLYGDLYSGEDTIFWVGVGIDKMDELDLFTQGSDGIYSLELGFYYNSTFIEPYTGLTGAHTDEEVQKAYEQVIADANLKNYDQYKWEDFHIVSAETGLRPQTDVVTQEVIAGPDMDTILGPDDDELEQNNWRMTYVAIERDPTVSGAKNRSFTSQDPQDPEEETKYLLIIPFRLKAFDSRYQSRLCLRLVRNAGMFSIGGGEDGSAPYAAWERVTTRNPGRELKLMANFRGDLNIFNGKRVRDELYDATLVLDNGGGTDNTAVLSVDGDPSKNGVSVNEDGQKILNLPGGTGMKVDVTLQTGYEVTVRVYPEADRAKPEDQRTYFPCGEVWDNDKGTYTFVMPNMDVIVEVIFGIKDNIEFNLYLDEDHTGEDPVVKPNGKVEGNGTVLTAEYPGYPAPPAPRDPETVTVDKDSPRDNSLNLPREKVKVEKSITGINTKLTVDVALHADYYAEVEIYNVANKQTVLPTSWTGDGISVISGSNRMMVPYGGQLILDAMPQSDVIVRVRYLPAKRVTAKLEVWHENTAPKDTNVAQLRTMGYNDQNEGMYAYSGVVYDNDKVVPEDHSAVKDPFRVLPMVETQAALLSGSLGGDGNTPVPWLESIPDGAALPQPDPDSILALLYGANTPADFANKLHAYDLRNLTASGLTKGPGLRKNAKGEFYTDSEMTTAYQRLLEIQALAKKELQDMADAGASTTPSGVEKVDVTGPDPADSTKTKLLFSYYKLTPDQVQAYLLDYERDQEEQEQYRKDLAQYNEDYQKYLDDVAAGVTPAPTPPTPPTAPAPLALRTDADAFVELAKYTWYDPSENHDTRPPTGLTLPPGHTIETRVGRRTAVLLESNSAYTVVGSVEILDANDRTTVLSTATRDPDHQNVYLFDMPDRDCIVKVTYKEREAHDLRLSIAVINGKDEPGNVTTVTAFAPDPDHPTAKKVILKEYRDQSVVSTSPDTVLEDSVVTVLVNKIPGYTVSASVVQGVLQTPVGTNPSSTTNMADGTVFTFRMPSQEAEIRVTYTRDVRTNNANLLLEGERTGATGYWDGTANEMIKKSVPEGEKLKAYINVAPGYYIVSAEAYTGKGAYPFTMSGNGWNNGQGGRVELDTLMPDEEYFVRVTLARYIPPEEGTMALTLQVMDPDNEKTGTPAAYDDNNATARASGGLTLGPVGLAYGEFPTPSGSNVVVGSAEPASGWVQAGETVTVEYELQTGYVLDSIVVEPAGLGVVPTFVRGGDNRVRAQFTMPAASATVVVTFRKSEEATRLFLNLNKTEDGVLATKDAPGEAGNTVTWVKSETFDRNPSLVVPGTSEHRYNLNSGIPTTVPAQDSAVTTGVALPGEWVTLNVRTAPGWYVHSVTVTDRLGIRQNYTPGTDGTEDTITFYMPSSDANVLINYRRGTAPDPTDPDDPRNSDRLLELLVLDPDNLGTGDPPVYDNNWAGAKITGAAVVAPMGPLGKAQAAVRDNRYVKPGDLVTVEYSPTAGYALDIITITAGGETLIPTYTVVPTFAAPGRATFLMPDANATVVVRFRAVTEDDPAHRYTANLILHPSGDDSVGVGTFDHDLSNRYYSRTALPGETIDFTAWAKDGYYIKRITVTPAVLGVSADYSGAFGLQNGSFVMPAADVQVNVFFEKLDPDKEWPQEAPYSVSLEVYDATGKGGKAHFGTIAGNDLVSPDSADVGSGERKTLWDYAQGGTRVSIHERDRVFVSLEPAADTYVRSVTVTDSRGKSVPWSYVPGGVAFDMSPAHVTVTVHYAQRTTEIDDGRKHRVTLHIEGASGADLAQLALDGSAIIKDADGDYIDGLFAGDTLTLTASPDRTADPYHSVGSAYVVVVDNTGGKPVVIPTTGLLPGGAGETTQNGMPLVAAGGTVRFAMPDADAAVYVKFLDQGIPKPDELTASLMVMGPVDSGSAVMTAAAGSGPILPPGTTPSTGKVEASGGSALFAPQRTQLTVDLTVNSGYTISSIRAVDFQGNDVPYTWTYDKNGVIQPQFTLTMPDVEGVRVYVELEAVDPNRELTAQVVVNNGGGSGNTAKLRTGGTVGSGVAILNPVHPGERIYLDLTVQPGYRVSSIRVVPARLGIAPSLTDKDTKNQTTSFTMPGEDVVVYVHFTSDGRTRRTATLVTTGQYHENNRAKIYSDFSGWSDEVSPKPSTYTGGKDTESVQAAPATATESAEWVTVNYTWDEFNVVDYVTVTYTNGVTTVPFTQNKDLSARKGEITFPMVDANVIVTVHYKKGSEPTTYEAVLHVIDMESGTEITDSDITGKSWGKLTWGSVTTGNITAKAPFPGNVASIRVPAGQTVTVDADTVSPGVYLWAGYVIYRAGGQMIRFEFDPDKPGPGFSGVKQDTFVMHPGRNDVYVYFTKTVPTETDYSAVLMLDSPAADKKSTAKIETDGDPNQTGTVTANTDPDHAYIVATAGDTITVTVKPDAGYAVESILMTPLGVSDAAGIPIVPTQAGNNYSFTMPAQNVAIRVKLKIDSAGKYVATLHYNSVDKGDGYVPLPDEVAWAILGYDTVSTNQDNGQLLVDENKQMDLSVCLNDGYLVLAAYVLQPDGTMVPLSDSLEGTTDVNKGKYDVDKAVNFRMPASDVDVYVWFTKTAPDVIWRTAVLTVTDNDGAGTVNSGLNTARFWTDTHPQATQMQIVTSGGVPTHGFFWVKEGEKVTVKIDLPYSGYVFNHPATISHSVTSAGTPTLLEDPGNAPEYVYTYNVGSCNSAVHAHFVASSITQNPLDVVVIDPDNPGGDQNTLEVTPGTLPKLTLISSSSAGARQRVPGVSSGATVDFVITPQPGYKTVAYLVSGGVRRQLTLTGNTGSFSMPDGPATLEVTLVKEDRAYSATLSILDTRDPVNGVTTNVSTAHMTEDAFQGRVSASTGPATPPATGTEKGTFPVLPNGTGLTASVDILGADSRIIGGVLITNQGSQVLPVTTNAVTKVDEYQHTLNGRDAELRILVEPKPADPNDRTYIASVTAVRLPSGAHAPTIVADPVNPLSGSSWTAAKKGNGITVTLDVPYGYRADLTVDGADVTLSETSVDATDATAGITGHTVEFNAPKMPARNVVVTVTYVKTRFTATITTGGNGSGKADLTATPTGGSTQKVNATGTIGDLKGGEALDFTATPDEGSEITRILMTTASGTTSFPTWDAGGAGSETMPTEDVTITVIFGKKRASSHYLDLHVSGASGGTATLAATTGTPASVSSSPSAPHGLSRIQAVEAGSDVTLTVTPEPGYHVTLGYYLHNGSTLTYVTNTVTADAGGTATFKMPNTSTCIYVTFRAGEDPDPNDPNKYLDLHVSGTGGGSATLTAAGVGTVSSTPTNPHSVSTLRPVGADVEVTLDVKPEPGYTAMVSYYVYNGGTPEPTVLTTIPLTGGVVKFPMPTESTCVYVTFRGPDKLPYLDLHVTNPQGGEATLTTDGFGTLSSTPAALNTFSRIDQVEAGTGVKLEVKPGADYTVSVSYYRHDGGNLYYESYLIDTGNGGTASFDMPGTATCIYVAFHGPGEEPDPDPNDPEKYLDLHVSGTQGGDVTLTPDGMTPMASTPTAPNSFDQRKPVAVDTNVTLNVTPKPGYTVSVSYYVHNSGGPVTVTGTVDSTLGGTVTFPMPAQSTCVYVTFKRQDNPDPNDPNKYLDLHVSGLANGSAFLTADGVGTVSSTPAVPVSVSTLQPVPANTNVTLNVTPEPGYAVTVSYYVHNGGSFAYTSNTIDNVLGGTATFLMPSESTCIYVHFHRPTDPPDPDPDPPDPPDPPEPELHIAYVTLVGTDGEPLNAAQSIVDTTTSGLGGGTLWAYGVAGDVMKTFFTVAPGYKAKVTAKRLDTNALVTVGQQGTTGSATATSTMPAMPDADMEVIITYSRDDQPNDPHTLTLRLVGHDGLMGNMATLKGGAADLTLAGTAAPSGANVTVSTTAELGDRLDLDANRESNYTMWATLEYTDSNGLQCVVNLPLNEYGTNGTSLLFMPDADAVVTVYYRLPYKATLFVIDAQGKDFENGAIGDTAGASAAGVVPKSTLTVTDSTGGHVPGSPITQTHTPITGLTGKENTATTVGLTTLPNNTAIASVIATTSSGTVNLTETAAGSGVYPFPMSTSSRAASDVDITVILRDTTKPDPMYIATVYKVGHDNLPGNGATIANTTDPTLPAGTIWSGAYGANAMEVTVTTAPGYYAVVTAVRTGTAISVPVLQMTATGPFPATFTMPAANVDVTVTYTKTPPEAPLKLVLKGHDQKGANSAYVNDADTHILIPTLTLSGAGAVSTADLQKASDSPVKAGTNLEVLTGVAPGYHVESITLTVPGLAPITLPLSAVSSAATTMPVVTGGGQAVITVTIAPGQKSPRPFDPTHSTIYMAASEYPVDPTLTDPGNPNLSSPDQEGWILADNQSATTPGTFVVTIPTLYDKPEPDRKDTLHDAGEGGEMNKRPIYTFYWKDDAGADHPLVVGTDISVEKEEVLLPANNPHGSYPAGSTHYGYQVTLKSLIANSKLSTYLEEGGTIYVTATCTHTTDDGATWVESDQTQVILQPAKTYTATLRVVDVSSSLNNRVELTVDGDTGNVKFGVADADGEKLEKLTGKEKLRTDVTPDTQVKVVSVLAIPSKGSPSFLSPDALLGGDYPYDMTKDDVDIVVTLANEDEELYTATVVKVDPAAEPGNTVKISNRTHPTLNRSVDDKWTLAYETDAIRVDATAAPGYRAVVTAVRLDDDTALPVVPTQGGGVMVIGLVGGMPASHVKITVTFEKVEDPNTAWVTLQMRMNDPARTLPLDPMNSARATGTAPAGGSLTLLAEDRNGYTDTQLVAAGALALASTLAPGYQIADVVWTVNGGAETSLGAAATGFTANAGEQVTVTVLLKEVPVTDRTPRPFDPAHSVEYTDATGYTGPGTHQNGYIQAVNRGSSKVEIPVPNLYDGPLHAAENVKYQLYAKVGGSMVLLREGVDYDTVIPVAAAAADHHAGGKDWRGQVFTIRSLDPAGVLGDYVKKGGVIYITATAPGKTESGYTEVLLPADPDPDGYTVTLKIIDDTYNMGTHNQARMQNADSGDTVTWATTGNPTDTAGSITGLLGGELIRTDVTVTAGEGVVYTVMAHSPTMGDILLFADPSGSIRYPKDMPTEDMDIIVHFRAESEHIHIAAVQKRGATAVPGNDATILNKTDWDDDNVLDLNHGNIWTEGRCDQLGGTADKIQVSVTTAEGFYATVTLSYVDPVKGPQNLTKVVLGSGNPTPLLVDFDMPDADVQVVVLFEEGRRSPRPFDPAHAEAYQDPADTDPYKHKDANGKNTPENVSTTDQEGWLLGENLGGGSALVTIPTLWGQEEGLENADNADFHFYLREKDATGAYTGNYILLEENVDYTLAHFDPTATGTVPVFTTVTNTYTYPDPAGGTSPVTGTYTGVKFRLLEVPAGKLKDLLDSGLSLYVSATKRETATPPWVEGEMTELVIPSTGLRPHDPDRVNPEGTVDPTYEDHWIRAENRGDYLIVTVPQLNSPNGDAPTSADDALHRFRLHLEVKKDDGTTEIVDVTDLLTITNVRGYDHPTNVNTLYDPDWDPKVDGAGNPRTPDQWEEYYENEVYNTTSLDDNGDPYNGARFIVEIKKDATGANADTLKKIFDNDGTMKSKVTGAPGDSSYRMYITSDVTDKTDDPVPDFRAMDYVDFEVPRYYRLNGMLESYAPTHIATVSLFRYDDTTGEAESTPAFAHRQFRSSGMGLWTLDFTIKSSELMGADRSGVDYQFVARKPGHVTFTWDHVELKPDNLDPQEPDQVTFTVAAVDETGNVVYDETDPTLIQAGIIGLFGGDVTGDDNVWMDDNSLIVKYIRGRVDWSTDTQKTDPDWAISVYNPESVAYRIDLNGDGYITVRDSDIWDKERNFNKNATDYVMPQLRTASPVVVAVMDLELLLAPDAYTVDKDTEIIKPIEPTPEGPDTYTGGKDTIIIGPIGPTPEDPAPDDPAEPGDPIRQPPEAPDAYTVDRDTTIVDPVRSDDSLALVSLSGKAVGGRPAIVPPRYDATGESSKKRE